MTYCSPGCGKASGGREGSKTRRRFTLERIGRHLKETE